MASVGGPDHVLLSAYIAEVLHAFCVRHGTAPLIRCRHGNRDWLLCVNVNVHIPALRSWMVGPAVVVEGGIQPNRLTIGWHPIEDLVLCGRGLTKRPGQAQ